MSKFKNATSIICITTDGADHRIDNFINQCSSHNIKNYKIAKFKPYKECGFTLTGRHIDKIHENSKGPTTSHLLAIKNWLNSSKDQYVLIMEDDISLETIDYWNFNFSEFIDFLPQDWECVQLSCIRESFDNIEIKTRSRLNSDWGCQAYLIRREYAKKLVDKYCISDTHFNLDNFNVKIQISPGEYTVYDLFPIVENILFEGVGVVYNCPLFVEDINNTSTNFVKDIGNSNDSIHIDSHNFVLNWWKNEGYNKEVLEINNHQYQDPITVIQIGAHHGYDDLSAHLFKNYKELKFGLFVEANPIHIEKLQNCYSKYKNIKIENIAIKPKNNNEDFLEIFYHNRDQGKQVASYDIEHVKRHEIKYWGPGKIDSFKAKALWIEDLLDNYTLRDIDWLYIDIEGLESDILLNLDFNKYKIKRLEFEQIHLGDNASKILNRLTSFGYTKVNSLHPNDWAFELKNYSNSDLTTRFALDTENDQLNFEIAYEYEKVGHTASAFSHYLRCAERTENINLAYECLIRGYYCFDSQQNKNFTSSHLLKQAISLLPKRPEAYFLLAKYQEKHHQWYESYNYCCIALELCEFLNNSELKTNIGYDGKEGLILCKAINGNHWDKIDESRILLNELIDNNSNLTEQQISNIEYHLTEIEKKRQKHLRYYKYQHDKLKIKFDGSQNIEENYSQSYQDLFVLSMTEGKKSGKYLEIGAGDPHFGNNTYLLEKQYGWQGLSIEINSELVDKFKSSRSNKIIQGDATKLNYGKILNDLNIGTDFDYLQLDCEPPAKTFETLLSIPFNKYRFSVITYEHDYYLDTTRSYREKSRKYLQSLGYKLMIGNVSMDDSTPFEDWWIHPDLIDHKKFESIHNGNIISIEKHLFN
jgi:FkbM family methyltransferase